MNKMVFKEFFLNIYEKIYLVACIVLIILSIYYFFSNKLTLLEQSKLIIGLFLIYTINLVFIALKIATN